MEPSKDQCFSYWLCCLLVYTSWKRICRIYFILVLDNIIYKIVFPYTTLSKGHQLWETDPKAASFQLPVGMYIFSPKFNKAFISLTVQHSLFIDFYTKLNIFSSISEWDMSLSWEAKLSFHYRLFTRYFRPCLLKGICGGNSDGFLPLCQYFKRQEHKPRNRKPRFQCLPWGCRWRTDFHNFSPDFMTGIQQNI